MWYGWKGWELGFRRVVPERGTPVYVCVSELPVGLVLETAAAQSAGPLLAALLPPESTADGTARGLRTWGHLEVAERGLSLSVNRRGWFSEAEDYPAGWLSVDADGSPGRVGQPTAETPMNYLPAPAAVVAADLLGCRLPTDREWMAAARQWGSGLRGANVRDQTWRRYALHLQGRRAAGQRNLPDADADSFAFAEESTADSKRAAESNASSGNADETYEINDAALWLRSTAAWTRPAGWTQPSGASAASPPRRVPRGLADMVGNVAEWVVRAGGPGRAALEVADLRDGPGTVAERRQRFIARHRQDFAVIGGSAMSPAGVGVAEPWPVVMRNETAPAARRGWSDVGLRMAFVAPVTAPAQRLREAVAEASYWRGE